MQHLLVAPPLANYPLHLACLTLSVLLLCTLTYFYARTITYALVACFVTEVEKNY